MPRNMLKKMLRSLCSQGAEFCHPVNQNQDFHRDPIVEVNGETLSEISRFTENIPGGRFFSIGGEGGKPYYEPERHPRHVEIIFPVSGMVDFLINYHWKKLDTPKTHILFRNTRHTERHCDRKPYTLLWLTCLPRSLTLHRTTYSPSEGYGQSACRIAIMPPMAKALWDCACEEHPDEIHFFSLLVQCLDFTCIHHLAEQRSADYHLALIAQIKEYLDGNFSEPVTLEELANMAHCSVVHLNRLFCGQYHQTIHRYLMALRFAEAKRLLESGFPPGEAAHRSGIEDQRYFCRFFRQRTGCSPSEYRFRHMSASKHF